MTSVSLAIFLGIAMTPVVLIFGPVYFPWSLLVLTAAGSTVGLTIGGADPRRRLVHVTGLAVLMLATVITVLVVGANLRVERLETLVGAIFWLTWVLLPMLLGVVLGASLRARLGIAWSAAVTASGAIALALAGAGLAVLAAPPEVTGLPACERDFMCPRTQCAYIAERRRFLTIERVVAFDGRNATCTYTAWGGIEIGRATVELDRTQSWTDGPWPRIVSFGWR